MEREHLIIIALILVALYMMNKDSSDDKVQGISPLGRIRYDDPLFTGPSPLGHIHTHEGFYVDPQDPANSAGQHIRLSDKYIGASQHVKQHIRNRNRNSMFNGMLTGSREGFACDPMDPANCA